MPNIKRNKIFMFASICLGVLAVLTILAHLYFPSCFGKDLQDVKYYKNGSYSEIGHGFKRYGKTASEYFPKYEEFSQGASTMDFIYHTGGYYFHPAVVVCIWARYDSEEDYLFMKNKIQDLGEYFGEVEGATNLLVDCQQRSNGENVYYIISFCDLDRVISHIVYFDSNDYNDIYELMDMSSFYGNYYYGMHPVCKELRWMDMG